MSRSRLLPRARGELAWIVPASLAWLALAATPAKGAFAGRPSVETLAGAADAAVLARVVECRSAWDPGRSRIYTSIRLAILEQWTGAPLGGEVRLTQLGGTVDGVTLAVPGLPRHAPGSEVVLFLRRTRLGNLHVAGLAEGVFHVRRDRGPGGDTVERDGASWDTRGDPARGPAERMSLAGLRALARAHARP
jgi:hypothetical protein